MSKWTKSGRCRQVFLLFGPDIGGRWPLLTGGRCSEVDLVLILLGRDLEWSLLTGGRYSDVVVNTGLTVFKKFSICFLEHALERLVKFSGNLKSMATPVLNLRLI